LLVSKLEFLSVDLLLQDLTKKKALAANNAHVGLNLDVAHNLLFLLPKVINVSLVLNLCSSCCLSVGSNLVISLFIENVCRLLVCVISHFFI
jgi:hypothetical protein